MPTKVLITGGAGFIGSHLADALLDAGYEVRAFDSLAPQVHGERCALTRPDYRNAEVELFAGDIRDAEAVACALEGVDAVVHLASAVGGGQSMYEIAHYTGVNATGTAVLLEGIIRNGVERLVVASCLSVYGEGLYRMISGALVEGRARPLFRLKARDWELHDAAGVCMFPVPTPESKRLAPASVYAISKCQQERLCMLVGAAYGIPVVALRLANVYGCRQALGNPYTGILARFAARFLNGQPPLIYEDGGQMRDFLNVRDAVSALRLAVEKPEAVGGIFNIGSGSSLSIRNAAEEMGKALGKGDIEPCITGEYRIGDIRHCFADITQARTLLGFEPRVCLTDGLHEMAEWMAAQTVVDRTQEAAEELALRGLTM